MSTFRNVALAFILLPAIVSLSGCVDTTPRDGDSQSEVGDTSDAVSDTGGDTTETPDGGELSESLRACCDEYNLPEDTCRERAESPINGGFNRCAGNSGCTELSTDYECGCRCTACHDETCLRVLCKDGPNCGGGGDAGS